MNKSNAKISVFIVAAIVIGLIAIYMLLSAVTTASLRYAHCGSSDLAAQEKYCRIASELLIAGYFVLAISFVLAGIAIWLRWKSKRKSR